MDNRCPVCHRALRTAVQDEPGQGGFSPFCSQRCKLRDLGAWLDADYKIISELHSGESAEPLDDNTASSDAQ
jgi:endogenous inhibitor of DNA gyrase (YacG/DUF329 family)